MTLLKKGHLALGHLWSALKTWNQKVTQFINHSLSDKDIYWAVLYNWKFSKSPQSKQIWKWAIPMQVCFKMELQLSVSARRLSVNGLHWVWLMEIHEGARALNMEFEEMILYSSQFAISMIWVNSRVAERGFSFSNTNNSDGNSWGHWC